jgi:hypothetical protein
MIAIVASMAAISCHFSIAAARPFWGRSQADVRPSQQRSTLHGDERSSGPATAPFTITSITDTEHHTLSADGALKERLVGL